VKAHVSSAIKVRLIQGAFRVLLLLAVCVTPFALGLLQSDVRFQNQDTRLQRPDLHRLRGLALPRRRAGNFTL
jgi:hypothetical protein